MILIKPYILYSSFVSLRRPLFLVVATVMLCACANVSNPTEKDVDTDISDRFKNQLALKQYKHPSIEAQIDKHTKNQGIIKQIDPKRQEIFNYVLGEIEKRNLPSELAMLPLIESAYIPGASAPKGRYIGLWQFAAPTAKSFGISIDKAHDGRYDIEHSTKAALDYLEYLNRMFDGDWALSVAAYNAGEGRILNLMKENLRQGKPTDFWSLNVPKITSHYVNSMIGLARTLSESSRLEDNAQILTRNPVPLAGLVRLEGTTSDVNRALDASNISKDSISLYNPKLAQTSKEKNMSFIMPISQVTDLKALANSNPNIDLIMLDSAKEYKLTNLLENKSDNIKDENSDNAENIENIENDINPEVKNEVKNDVKDDVKDDVKNDTEKTDLIEIENSATAPDDIKVE